MSAVRLARAIGASNLASILVDHAEFQRTVADYAAATATAREALAVHPVIELEARARSVLGETLWRQSRLDESQAEYERAREILERAGDRSGLADLFNKMASVEFVRGGRYEEAAELFRLSLAEHEVLHDDVMRAEDLNDLGACYRYLGRFEEAEQLFTQALELNRKMGKLRLEAINLCNIAGALFAQGQHDLAQQRAEEGRTLGRQVDDKVPQLWGYVWEGLAWQGMGELAEAERALREAVGVGRAFDNPRDRAGALARLGLLLADDLNRAGEGVPMLGEAIELLRSHGMVAAFSTISLAELEAHLDRLTGQDSGS